MLLRCGLTFFLYSALAGEKVAGGWWWGYVTAAPCLLCVRQTSGDQDPSKRVHPYLPAHLCHLLRPYFMPLKYKDCPACLHSCHCDSGVTHRTVNGAWRAGSILPYWSFKYFSPSVGASAHSSSGLFQPFLPHPRMNAAT